MPAASIPARAARTGPLRSRRLLALAGDARLVEQVRRGNEAAFEVVFERHGPAILAFCRHMLGSAEDAEDAVQHTFAAAYRDLQLGEEREIALKSWLFAIARNRCLSLLRARRDVPVDAAAMETGAVATAGLAEQVEQRADLRRLLADVGELPDEPRAALLLTELGDLSHAEVASVLGCEVRRVKALVFRARSQLIARREAREAPCERIREQLANLRGGSLRRAELRLHLRECAGCRAYREQVHQQRRMLAAALPVAPTLGLKASVLAAVGLGGGSAGGAATVAGALGGGTLAKVAVAGVLAGGGIVAGEAAVAPDRPAVAPSGPARAVDPGTSDAPGRDSSHAARPGVDAGMRGHAGGGASPAKERVGGHTKRGRERMASEHGVGSLEHLRKSTPVRRGPLAREAKPWKSEAGAKRNPPADRGSRAPAKGRSRPPATGPSRPPAGGPSRPPAAGRSRPPGKSNGRTEGSPSGRSLSSGRSHSSGRPRSNGRPSGSPKSTPGPKARGIGKPPAAPEVKADAIAPAGAKAEPAGQTP